MPKPSFLRNSLFHSALFALFLSVCFPAPAGIIVFRDLTYCTQRDLSNFAELRVCHEYERDDTNTGPQKPV